jgi:hypothetical protein
MKTDCDEQKFFGPGNSVKKREKVFHHSKFERKNFSLTNPDSKPAM